MGNPPVYNKTGCAVPFLQTCVIKLKFLMLYIYTRGSVPGPTRDFKFKPQSYPPNPFRCLSIKQHLMPQCDWGLTYTGNSHHSTGGLKWKIKRKLKWRREHFTKSYVFCERATQWPFFVPLVCNKDLDFSGGTQTAFGIKIAPRPSTLHAESIDVQIFTVHLSKPKKLPE